MTADPRFADLRRDTLAALRPPPKLRLSTWCESHVRLPSSLSATPGPMRLWPQQREILDVIGDDETERVSILKSARVGATQAMIAALGHFTQNDPAPVICLVPSEEDARTLVVSNIEPVFAESPALRAALDHDKTRDTLLHRRFPGGSLMVLSARAPRNLRARTARVIFADEVDGYEVDLRGEGDPVELAIKRTLTFANRKIVLASTPLHEDTSRIARAYEQSDKRVFEVPCPHCGTFAELLWKDIQWPEGRPENAAWACPACGAFTEDRMKPAMVEAGRWRATAPQVAGHAGFKLTALTSLLANASWPRLASEFLQAKKSPVTLQVFVNTVLGEVWRPAGDTIDEAEMQGRAEPFGLDRLPPECLILTAGVDVQHDRLECVTLGHSATETFVLDYRAFWGPVNASEAPWAELEAFLATRFPHPLGATLGFDAAAVDSSDGATMDRVLAFCGPRLNRRIVAIKGASGQRPAIRISATKGQKLFIVGVDGEKARLADRLKRGRTIRFSETLDRRFYEELASERRIVRYVRGTPVAQWERIPGRRAEALDCYVYAAAVRGLVGVDLTARADELAALVTPTKLMTAVRSKWLTEA